MCVLYAQSQHGLSVLPSLLCRSNTSNHSGGIGLFSPLSFYCIPSPRGNKPSFNTDERLPGSKHSWEPVLLRCIWCFSPTASDLSCFVNADERGQLSPLSEGFPVARWEVTSPLRWILIPDSLPAMLTSNSYFMSSRNTTTCHTCEIVAVYLCLLYSFYTSQYFVIKAPSCCRPLKTLCLTLLFSKSPCLSFWWSSRFPSIIWMPVLCLHRNNALVFSLSR